MTRYLRLLLVTTCGTSILTNEATQEEGAWIRKVSNHKEVEAERLAAMLKDRKEKLDRADTPRRRKLSAEFNAIFDVLQHYKPDQIHHLLIHTDTALGQATAELVGSMLDSKDLLTAGGLRTDNLTNFREAVAQLTRDLAERVKRAKDEHWFVVFNLTGGFKSLSAYLQALGMIVADECVFRFEGEAQLLVIPRLPLRLDEIEVAAKYMDVFRRQDGFRETTGG